MTISTDPKQWALDRIYGYAQDVCEGRLVACNKVIMSCRRFLSDLEKSKDPAYPWHFDEDLAARPIRFIERFLRPTKGSYAAGNYREFEHQAEVLREIGEGLIAAYTAKTGKSRDEIAAMLEAETYMNAQRCVDEGFADGILYEQAPEADASKALKSHMMQGKSYGPRAVLAQVRAHAAPPADAGSNPQDTDAALRSEIAQRAAFFASLYPET